MKTNVLHRVLSLLLVAVMLLSMVGCTQQGESGTPSMEQGGSVNKVPVKQDADPSQQEPAPTEPDYSVEDLDREQKEQIADLLDNVTDLPEMDDEQLNDLVEDLLQELDKPNADSTPTVSTPSTQEPSVDVSEKENVYDESGAMMEPFDQVYPELIENGSVAYSGESLLLKLGSGTLSAPLKAAGIGSLERIMSLGDCAWYEAKLTAGTDAETALAAVRALDEVLLAEYNYEVKTAALDDYKYFDADKDEEFKKNGHNKDQWHFHYCGIVDGYEEMDKDGGDPSVVVAVIDSGVDYDHEDLKDNMWYNAGEIPDNGIDDDGNGYIDDYYGVDIIAGRGSADDDNGHGTHVAGIIAARNNNVGVLGIAYNVKIMPIKAATHNGTLTQADIAKAVLYAYEMGAEVINMSFGGTACSIAVQDALAVAYNRCVLVASAGNSGKPNEAADYYPTLPNYPAALTYVLGVMSVDETGRESTFTNWDVEAFNGMEYELYAPGENIMSTLPGNKYGFLSGTSMAAPVVSAMAAILRSEFADRDMYPTKFIYGQLASTSDYYAECLDPEKHTVNGAVHDLPQIVNLNAALTELPKPEVGMQDFAIFDSAELSDKNNGDGVIDAGETIALGLTLRNRWGMSENTLVTIDTLENGIADPYVQIENASVDYGSVGTYSTQDAGKIMTGLLHTGWEKPFIVKIADNIPNDYRMTFHVTVTCENALDEADTATYESTADIDLTARNGVILPSVIEQDMVLTADNLYIIPNATVIQEGITVRVEPGTHIQFWSDNPSDPYASDYIAYLLVNGNFLVEGTKEDPVYIYPSQLMDRYGVEIGSTGTGFASLQYADVTNLFYYTDHTGTGNRIDMANHCTFRLNYNDYLRYRYLLSGSVKESTVYSWTMGNVAATNSVFYQIGYNYAVDLSGSFQSCIFNQCGITLNGSYQDCVFLGNALLKEIHSNKSNSDEYLSTSYNPGNIFLTDLQEHQIRVRFNKETGTTYIDYSDTGFAGIVQGYRLSQEALRGLTHTIKEVFGGTYVGLDHYLNAAYIYTFEVPGMILPEDIRFEDYAVDIDIETTYQLSPQNTPIQLPVNAFLYESSDEAVLTVSDTGLVTPVGKGTADVWVYSLDKAVKNRVTVTVKDYVALEGIAFPAASAEVAVGEVLSAAAVLTPANTTRKNVTYTSSNDAVATVDKNGSISGISAGSATITATCDGLTATMEVTVYQKATTIAIDVPSIAATVADETLELPSVTVSEGGEALLQWTVMDPKIASVEGGVIRLLNPGLTTLTVTDLRSGLRASATLYVCEGDEVASVAKTVNFGAHHYAMLEDGRVYYWTRQTTPQLVTENAKDIQMHDYQDVTVLHTDNTVSMYRGTYILTETSAFCALDLVNANGSYYTLGASPDDFGRVHVLTADGQVYAMGLAASVDSFNKYGELGIDSAETVTQPTLIPFSEPVVQIASNDDIVWYLTEGGNLYVSGGTNLKAMTPTLVARNVTWLDPTGDYFISDGHYAIFTEVMTEAEITDLSLADYDALDIVLGYSSLTDTGYYLLGIKDNKVYSATILATTSNTYSLIDEKQVFDSIENAAAVNIESSTKFVLTEDGMLYGSGDGQLLAGMTAEATVDDHSPILIPMERTAQSLYLVSDGLTEGVLTQDTLELTFSKELVNTAVTMTENSTGISVHTQITDNVLSITCPVGFVENATYAVVISAAGTTGSASSTLDADIAFEFTYQAPGTAENTEDVVIYESISDESIQRVLTTNAVLAEIDAYLAKTQYNYNFNGNAILNPISTDSDVTHWLRPIAPSVSSGKYLEIPFGGNYWGTTDETAIKLQMVDYNDLVTYARLMYAPYLTAAPENTFPFVTSVELLNKYGESVTTVGNEQVTFRVRFNRDMDTSIPLRLTFGSAYPYGDYAIEGSYVDARTWEGTYTLNTLIENGNQFFSISSGCSATDDLALQLDEARFGFEIDTSAAQALIMQGTATDTGIQLSWTQDDFDTLMGYNVYRSTAEDGFYQRLNATVIPAETMTFFDDTVEPGVVYYYNFTVVQTDLEESIPSGKIVIMSKDTMAPNIYHSPVYSATVGQNLVVSAEVTDNLSISYANLYFRVVGEQTWKTIRMNALNDKYSAIIPAAELSMDGMEYYIEAFDGISYTYRGTADAPFTVAVKEALDANALGDVDGDGTITNLDALLLLYTINDKYNMTAEEFARADLNGDGELWAAEALRILQYVSGVVGSVKM